MANEYLKRTPTSTGNRLKGTWSFWVKRNGLNPSSSTMLFNATNTGTDALRYNDDDGGDSLRILFRNPSSNNNCFINYDKLRDVSSWQHYLIVYDSTLNTDDNMSTNGQELQRIKLFVNGRRMIETGGNSAQNPGLTVNQLMQNWGVAGVANALFAVNGGANPSKLIAMDTFFVDGQALTPDVFGFYKDGNGYISVGTTQSTDFRSGQWVPKKPSTIKNVINNNGGFGVNGYYLPLNDSSNFGADFHCDPNTIITLQDETAPQPKNGAPTTTDSYVSQLRSDPYAANLVLAIPGITGGQGSGYGDYSADIKGSGSNKTVTANGDAGIAATASYYGSAMQFDGTGDYFTVPNTSDFRFTSEDFTIEAWVKTNDVTDDQFIFSNWNAADNRRAYVFWLEQGTPRYNGGTDGTDSSNGMIDPGNSVVVYNDEWAHVAVSKEGSTNRVFLNGVCVGVNTTGVDIYNNTTDTPRIGGEGGTGTREFNGYIQDLRVYKGVAKYKGGFDVPKPYRPVGIATWREVTDTTGNNFATLNPLNCYGGTSSTATLTNGNLTQTTTNGNRGHRSSTIGITTGKWYAEVQVQNSQTLRIGVIADKSPMQETDNVGVSRSEFAYLTTGAYGFNGALPAYGDSYTNNDVIGIALNRTDGTITFFKNGVSQGIATDILNNGDYDDQYFNFISADSSLSESGIFSWNFGQNPTFSGNVSVSSTQRNADVNGKGQFRYAPPADHLALCEDNLPAPEIADPGDYFKTVLYRGNGGSSRSIAGVGFKPDFVWIKKRSGGTARSNQLFDSVRGGGYNLHSDSTGNEDFSTARLLSFNDDGFSISDDDGTNASNGTYVAWCWQAGAGTTSTNTDGSINSVVSVNQDAGFSIVTYTGNGTSGTVGHGLSKAPQIIIVKNRFDGSNWSFNGTVGGLIPGTNKMVLQDTGGIISDTNEVTSITDTLFNIGNSGATNGANDGQVAYCWHEVEGFSKFGSYLGNGNTDGAFVYCGFKPAWVMIKQTNDANNWHIEDSSRKSVNPVNMVLRANLNNAESANHTSFEIDLLSNGFKLRSTNDELNENGSSYFFMAFAESPFKTANAK